MFVRTRCTIGRCATALLSVFVLALLHFLSGVAAAQNVVRVEEDWELVLGEPDANSIGPQVATTMSPNNNLSDTYFTLEMNHRTAPSWSPGGISIHRWSGDWRMGSFDRADRAVMTTNNETVTWTQALYVGGGKLTYQIIDGASTTWGPFGYSSLVKLDLGWGVAHINSYSPAVSVANSGPAFGGNRVQSLKIKQIRLTLDTGAVVTDSTERVVHVPE